MKIGIIPGGEIPLSNKLIFSTYAMANIAYLLTEELIKRGHKIVAFTTSDSKTSAKIAPGWLSSLYLKRCENEKKRVKLFEKYYQNIISLSSQFDLLHLNEFIGIPLKLLKGLECPLVITLHVPRVLENEEKLVQDKFMVAISKNQMKKNPHIKFQGVVYNGIPVELYDFNEKPGDFLFFIGRISYEKGLLDAIKVAEITKKKLLIAGPLPSGKKLLRKEKQYIKKVFREIKKNKDNVRYLGVISGKEKLNYFKNAYCFLFPVKYEEPFGLTMIESMACGTPVIAFSRGAAPEVIKDGKTGFLVKTIPQMVKAIEKIPEISRKECRKWVEKKFTVQKMAEGYEKIYRNIIKKNEKR